jgi:iron complex transport system ATP-binding protein
VTVLQCKNLDLDIAGNRVVRNLNLELVPGQFWAMLGPNGIGKTTLLKCMAGLIRSDAGELRLEDQLLDRLPRRAVARLLGMLQQHTVYVFDASVLQTALTGRHPHLEYWQRESAADLEKAISALHDVDLAGFEQRSVTRLSGGEARRLAFATLMVQEPELWLLDEPTNHLDLKHQVRIMGMIEEEVHDHQHAAIAALHDVNLAARYCTHVLMLFGDGNWCAGETGDMLTETSLEQLYQCPVEGIETASGTRFHPAFPPASD